jgi:hypothetical protein
MPGARRRQWMCLADAADRLIDEQRTGDRITIADHEPRILVVSIGDGVDKALPRVLRARRRRHADVDDFPPGQVHEHEAVEDLEPKGDDRGNHTPRFAGDGCGQRWARTALRRDKPVAVLSCRFARVMDVFAPGASGSRRNCIQKIPSWPPLMARYDGCLWACDLMQS